MLLSCFTAAHIRRTKPRKKENLNDSLKSFAPRNKKLFAHKKDLHKKHKEEHESTTQLTTYKILFSYMRHDEYVRDIYHVQDDGHDLMSAF